MGYIGCPHPTTCLNLPPKSQQSNQASSVFDIRSSTPPGVPQPTHPPTDTNPRGTLTTQALKCYFGRPVHINPQTCCQPLPLLHQSLAHAQAPTFFAATSTVTSEAQKASAAPVSPSSSVSVVYILIAGQEAAPQLSAKWMRASTGVTTCRTGHSRPPKRQQGNRSTTTHKPRRKQSHSTLLGYVMQGRCVCCARCAQCQHRRAQALLQQMMCVARCQDVRVVRGGPPA